MARAARSMAVAAVVASALAGGRAGAATYNVWQDTGTVIGANEGSTNVPATALTTGSNSHRTLMQAAAQGATTTSFRSVNTNAAATWTKFARIYLPADYATAQTISAPSAYVYVRGTATTDQIQLTLVDFDPAGVAGNGVVLFTSSAVSLPTTAARTAFTTWTGAGGTVPAGHRLVLEAWVRPNAVGNQARIYPNNGTTTQSTLTVTETPATTGTAPGAPGGPTYAGVTATSLTASWSASATGTTPITYTLSQGPSATGPWTNVAGCAGVTGLSCPVTGLVQNTTYFHRVTATNAAGSTAGPVTSRLTLPAAPTMAPYTNVGPAGVTASWTMAAPTAGLTYVLQRGPSATGPWTTVTGCVAGAVSCDVTGLAAATTYWFQVQAANAVGSSAFSAATSVTTVTPTLTIANATTGEAASTLAPGAAKVVLDAFTLATSSGTVTPSSLTVTMPAGSAPLVEALTLESTSACNQATPHATIASPATDAPSFTAFTGLSVGTAPVPLFVCLKPRTHASMPPPPGSEVAVTGRVSALSAAGYTVAGADLAGPARTIDNLSPEAPTKLSGSAANAVVQLSWTSPADAAQVVVLRWTDTKSGVEVPAEGAPDYAVGAAIGTATVACVISAPNASCLDTAVVNGTTYAYRSFARDASRNFSLGADATPPSYTPTAFVPEGHTQQNSPRPVISIVTPAKGVSVSLPVKVQARIFSPNGRAVTVATVYVDGAPVTMTMSAGYGTTPSSGVWEAQLPSIAEGPHELRAYAENGAGGGGVYSAIVPITVRARGAGDGHLLARENSSQLCDDCHAMASHTSESAGSKYGSWSSTCRDCHAPHGSRNIALVNEQITPPAIVGPQSPKPVVFYRRTGGASSYTNDAASGPCQVCHTRTTYYRADGSGATHNPGTDCGSCHSHSKGLAASCTGCHGTVGRAKGASVAGSVDSALDASPPVDAAGLATGTRVGAHLAHVNQGTYRTSALACADCHPWPNVHQTPSERDAAWSALASTAGERPYAIAPAAGAGSYDLWETGTPSCTNWCHGAGLGAGGGSLPAPTWTLGSSQAACGTCHASPPPVDATAAADHPQNAACGACHGAGYAQAAVTGAAKDTHVDGTIQKPANGCTACHGKLAGAAGVAAGATNPEAAPGYDALSVDTRGSSDRLQPGVGAHGAHVNAGMMSGKTCDVCHPLPADGDRSHASGGATDMRWSAPANVAVTPTYTSPTCTNYCHSTGDPMGAATPVTTAISWVSQAPLGCTSCHATAALATNAHPAHVTAYACSECHVGTTRDGASIVAGGGTHVNGGNDVGFDASSALVQGGGYAGGQCSNVYCHSTGTKRSPPYASGPSLAWNAGATTCTSCHGGAQTSAAPLATGKHPNHVNLAGTIGGAASTNLACGACHASTVAAGTSAPVTGAAAHVDRVASVTLDPRYGGTFTAGATEGTGSCAATYCHSSGQDPAATPAIVQYRTVAWNQALGCNGCHGTGNATGAPDYASGAAGSATANSHGLHVTSAADCAKCHAGTAAAAGGAILATSTLHLDRSRQVQLAASLDTNGAAANYDAATKTCSGVSCHGSGTPRWGGAGLKCSDCHVGAADVDSFAFGTAGVIGTSEWTSRGHGQAAFGFPTIAAGTPCLYCHDGTTPHDQATNPFRLRGATIAGGGAGSAYSAATPASVNQVCLNCHAPAGANGVDPDGAAAANPLVTSARKIDAYHAGPDHGVRNGGTRCWDCHDPHGDGANVKMIGSRLVQSSTDAHGFAATRVAGVAFTANAAGTDYANASPTSLCRACHVTAAHYNATTNDGHNSGSRCVSCHAHAQPPNLAFKDSGACNACHGAPPAPGKHAAHDETAFLPTSYTDNARHGTATQYGFACNTCHAGTHLNATAPYSAQVVFGSFGTTAVGGTYAPGAAQPADITPGGLTFNWTNGACNATYCHSNAAPAGGASLSAAPTWNEATWVKTGATASQCTKCHQMTADSPRSATSTRLSYSHWVHVAATAAGGSAYDCSQCHDGVATGRSDYPATAASIADKARHVNGVKDVSIASRGTMVSTQPVAGACNAVYCHSSGRPATAGATSASKYAPVTWGQAGTLVCNGCHGTYVAADGAAYGGWASAYGEPNYANGGANVVSSNSHRVHATSAASCAVCHQQTTANGTSINAAFAVHSDGARQVTWDAAHAGATYSATTKSCGGTGSSCHAAGTPTWGGTVTCLDCHGTTGAEVADVGASFWTNGVMATLNTTEWGYSGHGKATGTYDVTLNPAAALPTAPTPGTSQCLYCHDAAVGHQVSTNPFRLRGAAGANGVTAAYSTASPNAACLNCHAAGAVGVDPDGTATAYALKRGTILADTAHDGTKHSLATLGGKFCWDCHDAHGDRASAAAGNIAMIGSSVTAVSDGTHGYAGASGVQRAVTYNTEAASPPATGKAVETTTAASAQHVGICQACHAATGDVLAAPTAWTKYWNRLGQDDPDGPGGVAPVASAHNSGSTTTPYCVNCHPHDKKFAGSGACTDCHGGTQLITMGPLANGTNVRRAIVPEFAGAWSHKRSASPAGSVTKWDCIVCHMEGDMASGDPSGVHADGYVNLRDPDTGANIKGVTFAGGVNGTADPGTYSATAADATFPQFSRNLASATLEPAVQAIMLNQCLKCHDANGALSTLARVPTTGTAEKPFGTTIAGAGYTGAGVTANGVLGGVHDVYESFKTTNASYHPILGKQNNWYARDARMVAPWNMGVTARTGTVNLTTWGPLISCWDCHAPAGATGVQTRTITAHGGAATIRQSVWLQSTTDNLCRVCHVVATTGNNHGVGSAWASGGHSTPGAYARDSCHRCHMSAVTKPTRPRPAQDVHGFDRFASSMGTDQLWPVGTTESHKPYAFMRNVGTGNSWSASGNNWKPLSGPGVATGAATCVGNCNRASHGTYTPGGAF